MLESTAAQVKLIRKYLKLKIIEDNITFRGHNLERHHVHELMRKTIVNGESHSALVIGARGCGKTTLINSVLSQLSKEVDLENDAIIVRLNGLLHHDEKIALKAITAQMQLDNAVGDRVFGSFAENLSFLLGCIRSGADRRCKSMLFLLDHFHMFCHTSRTQTLLYNLFDVTVSGEAPVCVIGLTSRLDVIELLEKRVKSRFSHRHIFLYPAEAQNDATGPLAPLDTFMDILRGLLTVPEPKQPKKKAPRRKSHSRSTEPKPSSDTEESILELPGEVLARCSVDAAELQQLDRGFVEDWNAHIGALLQEERVVDAVEKFCYYTVNEQVFRDMLFQIVSRLSPAKPCIDASAICQAVDATVGSQHRVSALQSLSVLEISLLVAFTHAREILQDQPINFEMLLHRYTKFANANSSTQSVPRPVILKAFEHLQALEIVMPVKGTDSIYNSAETTASRVQKEYQWYTLAIPKEEIDEAIKGYKALPTEISQWYTNSVM